MGKKGLTTDEKELIKLLSAKGESCYAISLQVKRSPHTIKKYLSEPQTSLEVVEKKKELSDLFEDVARRMIESITNENIQNLDAYKRTLSAGIATDKMRLLKEQSTAHIILYQVHQHVISELFNPSKPQQIIDTQDVIDNSTNHNPAKKAEEECPFCLI